MKFVKRWLFWSFDRGSFQYDVLCALILVLMFAIPPGVFNDRPDYMRLPDSGVRQSLDDGLAVYTVKVGDGVPATEEGAIAVLGTYLDDDVPDVFRSREIHDTRGHVVAYAFWLR